MEKGSATLQVQRHELVAVLEALATFESELEQLEISEEWFVSDSRDRLTEAKGIIMDILGITEYATDEEVKQINLELRFDED